MDTNVNLPADVVPDFVQIKVMFHPVFSEIQSVSPMEDSNLRYSSSQTKCHTRLGE